MATQMQLKVLKVGVKGANKAFKNIGSLCLQGCLDNKTR